MGVGQPGPSPIVLGCLINATMKADQMMEVLLTVRLNSVLIRAIVAAYGVGIEFEGGYTGRNREDMENQVEMLILNKIPRMYVLCSIFKMS